MNSFSISFELRNLLNLLTITEELLFSIPLNSDLVEKYLILRETGLKKSGLPVNNTPLWDLQKKAHEEINEKHNSQEKQLKDLSENLAQSRRSYKDLLDISQKMLEFLRSLTESLSNQSNLDPNISSNSYKNSDYSILKCEGSSFSVSFSEKSKPQKESLYLSLASNQSLLNNLQTEFNKLKDDLKNLICDQSEKKLSELKSAHDKYTELSSVNQENESKIRELQRKLSISEEELKLKHEAAVIELRRSFTKEIEDLKSTLKIQEARKTKEIEELREKYESEIRALEEENTYAIENLSVSIKNTHKQELKELELSFRHKESELLEELDIATKTDSSVLKSLRENLEKTQVKVQDLREVLRAINERTNSTYLKYAYKENIAADFISRKEEISRTSSNKLWHQYSELLSQLDFIELAFKKLSADNEWLVEQVEELSRESECTKETQAVSQIDYKANAAKDFSFEQVLSTLSANELIVKDFQDARSKLLKQFADSKKSLH